MTRKDKLYLIGPTESILTKRGNRFPNLADFFVQENELVIYYTSNFYHAEKRFFSRFEIKNAKSESKYELHVLSVLPYYNNVSVRRVLTNFLFSLKLFFILLFKVKKRDKILLPSRPVELIFFISIIKRLKGASIYLDIQDVWPDALKIENKRKKRIFETYCNIFLKPSLKHYMGTIHTAPSFKTWLGRYSKKTPSIFIPLGWENKRWEQVQTEYNSINEEVIKLVCIAQLQYQIDVIPILGALKDDKRFFLTIMGEDGKGERYIEVVKYIEEHKINNVKIIGKVERNDMVKHLHSMHIGILPMITSSIPNKIFDYMASMLPIIVLGSNDSSKFVKENEFGWNCDFDSSALKVLLQSISFADIQMKREKVIKGRREYSRDILHQKIKNLIH